MSRRSSRVARVHFAVLAALTAALVSAPRVSFAAAETDTWSIEILSSRQDHVTGGDALVRVGFPGSKVKKNAQLLLNGVNVIEQLKKKDGDRIGVLRGFVLGDNLLELKPDKDTPPVVTVVVTDYPTSGPIFSGPQQQPFVCTTARNGLGQPIVDNQDHFGIPVAQEDGSGNYPADGHGYPTSAAVIVGWSKNCEGRTRFDYLYRNTAGDFVPLESPAAPLPADVATITTSEGFTVPFLVRRERGTIDRFVYSIVMLAPVGEKSPTKPDDELWNERLVFSFDGGVAIGRTQGTIGGTAMFRPDQLALGYAVITSSGLRTNTHYNLQLGGENALMLKEHFIEGHALPRHTIGVGGSGGGIQQYVYAQNHPGLIDAAIAQYAYSDMITQTIHVGDCELLEHYFDKTDRLNNKWDDVLNRRAIEGLNASRMPIMDPGEASQWNQLYGLYLLLGLNPPVPEPGSTVPAITECRRAWFGLTPLVLNPNFTDVDDLDKLAQGVADVDWTHAGDAVNIYGTDAQGFGRTPWDNVGVQYGLQALTSGVITPAEFLDLNAKVGSWKEPGDMVQEGFPFVGPPSAASFDPWSERNMNLSPDGGVTPAQRRHGSLEAMNAAYDTGMRFDGDIGIPVIDWRHYLEEELDMHHSHQSFATRRRIQLARGNADNQVIWFTDARPAVTFDQTPEAFTVMEKWLQNLRVHPERGVAGNKPPLATDRCFTTAGVEIAHGPHVWDGVLDNLPPGPCTQMFPLHSTTRRVAGGPFEGGVFKCALQSVDAAIASGTYGSWVPSASERTRLMQIFPEGVCDWTQDDLGRPR